MKSALTLAFMAGVFTLALWGSAQAQGEVEMRTGPGQQPRFEIVPPGPATREVTKPREADSYRDDVRVRHEPAFIEPFVGRTEAGNEFGLSGWTAPNPPVGSLASQGHQQSNGWFALGITFLFDYPPKAATRHASARR